MVPLKTELARKCEGYFPGVADTALLSALQGYMGWVEVDDPENIRLIVARCGDYFYFGGDPSHPEAERYIRSVPSEGYLVSLEKPWQERFLSVLGDRAELQHRYIIRRDMSHLDRAHLRSLCETLPEGFTVVPINKKMAEALRSMHWSHEYVNQFRDAQDFVERGFGFAVMHGEDIACVGVTFSLYDGGMEMGIATNPAYRRLGLATIASARTVLEALDRGWELNWDAANPVSLRLACKMGFEPCGEYDLVLVK